jgi:hypothetical protein
MIILLLIIVGVCAVAAAVATLGRSSRPDEVERFHRARAMTTEWSRHHPTSLPAQQQPEREPEHVEH